MINTRLLAPKLFYFFWFAAFGSLVPFIGLYYREIGLDLAQIGWLASLSGLTQLVVAPLWGVLADTFNLRRLLLPLAVVGTILPTLLISQTESFSLLLVLVVLQAMFTAPISALADSATITLLGAAREQYGVQRVWGTVGWGLSTIVTGWLIARVGLRGIFGLYAGLGVLAALSALALPRSQLAQTDLRGAAQTLLRDRRWFVFFGCVLLIGCNSAIISSFLSLYLQDLGASSEQIGLGYTIATISELPVMVLSPWLIRRWSARGLMIAGGVLYAIRTAIYLVAPSVGWALVAQILQGPCYAALWTGGVVEAQRLAPRGLEATAQSLFGLAVFGIAAALANAVGGAIYRDLGVMALFGTVTVTALLGALALLPGLVGQKSQPLEQTLEQR
ncbi:MAG TPA: MFS transporter [Herpetosiphonaceae bacterium]